MKKLRIDVWSDVACPWCYVGKRRLEAAIEKFAHRDSVEIVWRAFELDPTASREPAGDTTHAARLSKKLGIPVKEAQMRLARLTEMARADGIDFHFELYRPSNTFDVHRVVHLAAERGIQSKVKERLLRAFLSEGEIVGDEEALIRLAAEAGLDAEEVRATLASDAYAKEVRADQAEAREIGVGGAPFFVLDGKYAISGAQPTEVFAGALAQAWAEVAQKPEVLAEGAVCTPDGCD